MTHPLASYLDFANHRANATTADIEKLCQGVLTYGFNGAFVNPVYIALAKKLLAGRAKAGSVVSFPLGQDMLSAKLAAAKECLALGADELDIVPNIALFLEEKHDDYLSEMKEIVSVVKSTQSAAVVKFIIDTGYILKDPTQLVSEMLKKGEERIKKAADLIAQSGADFVKICSGWGPRGASPRDVELVKEAVGNKVRVKASGGIDTYAEALALINVGADRLGTSHAIEIVQEERRNLSPPSPSS